MSYIARSIEPHLRRVASEFPAVLLTGARQAGKTTLLRELFGASHRYVSVEAPDLRAAATADPRGFLAAFPPPVILDEIQHAAILLPYIKELIDADRSARGRFILTGSQNLMLLAEVSETLAGRVAVTRLLPLAAREIAGAPERPLPWEVGRVAPRTSATGVALWPGLLRGGFPELVAEPGRDLAAWHSSYLQTYLERDVRGLRQIGDLTSFQSFLRALAARSAQLVNLSSLGRDLGVAVNTVKAWLSVLEATHQVLVLRPYFANVGKRLVKTPKVYFTDTGTLCHLVGLRDPDHAAFGPMGGAIFETAVLMEIVKALTHRGEQPQLYFWRTAAGVEVDLVVDRGEELVPIEVKLSSTPTPAMADGIARFRADLGPRATPGYLVHPGALRLPLGPHASALPFAEL